MQTKQLKKWYLTQVDAKQLIFDAAQLVVIQELDDFVEQFAHNHRYYGVFAIFNRMRYHGYYIYGKVGRGKSLVMNELYRIFPAKLKLRIHFHQFMYNVQQQLAALKNQNDPLKVIAKQLRRQCQVLFLDEMLVNDIANAMILQNLLLSLFASGVYVVTTSNTAPQNLYADGLMRERFLPAIVVIQQQLCVMSLETTRDYRLLHNSDNSLFYIADTDAHEKLDNIFNKHSTEIQATPIMVHGRYIPVVKQGIGIIWFEFKIICGDSRSQLDYLELVKTFDWFIIENIVPLSDNDKDVLHRFTCLIDILYDNHCKLALSSSVDITEIYANGEYTNEFARTKSRLIEMQTEEYVYA